MVQNLGCQKSPHKCTKNIRNNNITILGIHKRLGRSSVIISGHLQSHFGNAKRGMSIFDEKTILSDLLIKMKDVTENKNAQMGVFIIDIYLPCVFSLFIISFNFCFNTKLLF